jgi:hypothetical protein
MAGTVRDGGSQEVTGRWLLTLLMAVTFGVYGSYALFRHDGYLTAGYDLGIFDQAVRGYAGLRAPVVPLRGPELNIWADHAHPIIALAAPLYRVWDSPVVLLVLQAGLVAASLPFVRAFTRRRTGPRTALVVTTVFAAGWPLQGLVAFDFHEIAFALPLLAMAIDALDRRSDRALLVSAGLLLLVREDLGVVVAVLGLLRTLQPRRWLGAGMALIGASTYLVLTAVVIPAFAPDGRFAYWTFDSLGPNLPRALGFVAAHPLRTMTLLALPAVKAQMWLYLLAPLGLLSLRSRYLVVAVAGRAVPQLAREPVDHAFPLQLSALGGAHAGHGGRRRAAGHLVPAAAAPSCRGGAGARAGRADRVRFGDAAGAATPARRLGPARRRASGSPAGRRGAGATPGCVSVDDRLAPHLTAKNRVTLVGIGARRTDYVVLDLAQERIGSYLGRPLERPGDALNRLRAEGFVETFRQEQLVLLRSPTYAGPTPGCAP